MPSTGSDLSGAIVTRRALLAASTAAFATPAPGAWRMVHATDWHIQPELNAAAHCARCVEAINRERAELVIMGGDLVFDVNQADQARASMLFHLYESTIHPIRAQVASVIGNHDLFAIRDRGQHPAQSAAQARAEWERTFGKRYYRLKHWGWQVIVLDSVDVLPTGGYRGWIDAEQLAWLKTTLAEIPQQEPILVVTHIPLVTGFTLYGDLETTPQDGLVVANAREVCTLLYKHNVRAVLQGHTHICETVEFRGIRFITTGAVCGDWWRGKRFGFPLGYGLLEMREAVLSYRYVSYEA